MRVLVLLNDKAGTLAGSAERNEQATIRDRFAAAGWTADVRPTPGDALASTASAAARGGEYEMIVAGGGDGTLNTVAGALVGTGCPFGALPLGTFNHLAKELEMPLDLAAAVDALAAGRTVPLNVGRVNDRVFLSFAAIGIYSEMIRHRDAQRKSRGRKKMWAGTIAGLKMLFRWPLKRVCLHVDSVASIERPTPFVYVSLSGLQIDQMGVRGRPDDVRSKLNIFIAMQKDRLGLLKLLARATFRRVRAIRDVELYRAQRCELTIRRHRHVHVGYDGEIETMTLPLKFELVRDGLQVRVPQTASKYVRERDPITP